MDSICQANFDDDEFSIIIPTVEYDTNRQMTDDEGNVNFYIN